MQANVPELPIVEQVEQSLGQEVSPVVREFLAILERQHRQKLQNVTAEWLGDPSLTMWQEKLCEQLQAQVYGLLKWAEQTQRM